MFWTQALDARIRELDEQGLCKQKIAEQVGVTRDAVFGRLRRLRASPLENPITRYEWTDEQVAIVRALYPTDTPVALISEQAGHGVRGINTKARELGLKRPGSRAEWTPELIATLRRLHGEAKVAQDIADEIGVGLTKHAVLGKLFRLGLACERSSPNNPDGGRLRKRVSTRGIPKGPYKPRLVVTQPEAIPAPSRDLAVLFMDRRQSQCSHLLEETDHLPIDQRLCCGAPISFGSFFRFCEYHKGLFLEKPKSRASGYVSWGRRAA